MAPLETLVSVLQTISFFTHLDTRRNKSSLPPSYTYREGQVANKHRDSALRGTGVEGVTVVAHVLGHLLLQVVGVVL